MMIGMKAPFSHAAYIQKNLSRFDREQWSLSPEGAKLLVTARDIIVQDPSSFDMDNWECGTTACIGGHLCRLLHVTANGEQDTILANYMGMTTTSGCFFQSNHPLYWLFFQYGHADMEMAGVERRINAFLNHFGYDKDGKRLVQVEARELVLA